MTEEGKKWKDDSVTICYCPGSGDPIAAKGTILWRAAMGGAGGMILHTAGHSATDPEKQGHILC